MKRGLICMTLAAVVCLGGCVKHADDWQGAAGHGRYFGVGIYGPDHQWRHLVATQVSKDTAAARPIDDQVIIVVENSVTGEVRACGDLTGYCIGMNPWKTQLLSSQISPVKLTKHVPPDASDATETPAKATAPAPDSGAKPAG